MFLSTPGQPPSIGRSGFVVIAVVIVVVAAVELSAATVVILTCLPAASMNTSSDSLVSVASRPVVDTGISKTVCFVVVALLMIGVQEFGEKMEEGCNGCKGW